MNRFEGKVAIITGGASGIGKATAIRIAQEGGKVVVADFMLENAQAVVEEIKAFGGEAVATFLNAAEGETIKTMIDFTIEQYGKIDVLHNNVGVTNVKTDVDVVNLDIEEWDRVMNINVKSYMLGCKYVIPHMIKNGGGSIINTASMAGSLGNITGTAYGSSKAATINLTKYVATQYGKMGVRVNAVAPGLILTPAAINNLPKEMLDMMVSHHALDTAGEPNDISSTVAFLASDEAKYITGQTIDVDGGWGIHNPTVADMLKLTPIQA